MYLDVDHHPSLQASSRARGLVLLRREECGGKLFFFAH